MFEQIRELVGNRFVHIMSFALLFAKCWQEFSIPTCNRCEIVVLAFLWGLHSVELGSIFLAGSLPPLFWMEECAASR